MLVACCAPLSSSNAALSLSHSKSLDLHLGMKTFAEQVCESTAEAKTQTKHQTPTKSFPDSTHEVCLHMYMPAPLISRINQLDRTQSSANSQTSKLDIIQKKVCFIGDVGKLET